MSGFTFRRQVCCRARRNQLVLASPGQIGFGVEGLGLRVSGKELSRENLAKLFWRLVRLEFRFRFQG